MSASRYAIYLSDPLGVRLGDASNFVKLSYTRVVNDVGTLKLWLPADFDTNLIRIPDGRIEVWRRLPGSSREYLDTETIWLIKAMQWDRDDHGNVSLLVEADSLLCIIRDRQLDTPYAVVTAGPADDQIKELARDYLTATSYIPANWPQFTDDTEATYAGYVLDDYLSIAPNISLGASLAAWNFAWKPMLPILRDMAAASTKRGKYVAFDFVCPTPSTIEFRTYAQQRGVDHRFPNGQNPIIFGAEMSNVGQSTLRIDYRKEVTYATAAGAGQSNSQRAGYAWDIKRIYAVPFGRRNTVVSATNQNDQTVLDDIAGAAVQSGRARFVYRGRLISVPDCRYGVHWGWGDFVTVQDYGQSFDCRIEAVTVTVDKNRETIDAYARNDT